MQGMDPAQRLVRITACVDVCYSGCINSRREYIYLLQLHENTQILFLQSIQSSYVIQVNVFI